MRDLKNCKLALAGMAVVLLIISLTTVFVYASDSSVPELPRPEDVLVFDDSSVPEPDEGEGESSSLPEPVEEDEPLPVIMPMAVGGTAYPGAISATILDYFRGFMSHRPGVAYVCFRADQYNYYLFYGSNLSYNSRFVGSGSYIRYYSYDGSVYRGTDTVNIAPGNAFVYSNLDESFPAFYEERGLWIEKTTLFVLCIFVCLWVFSKIFFRSR